MPKKNEIANILDDVLANKGQPKPLYTRAEPDLYREVMAIKKDTGKTLQALGEAAWRVFVQLYKQRKAANQEVNSLIDSKKKSA
jgi:hypothetical protein